MSLASQRLQTRVEFGQWNTQKQNSLVSIADGRKNRNYDILCVKRMNLGGSDSKMRPKRRAKSKEKRRQERRRQKRAG